jgi:addiction module RelB/DinJ family antitoxin
MSSIGVTVHIDENTKRDFDTLCEDIGINITTAINMLIKASVKTKKIPYENPDSDFRMQTGKEMGDAFRLAQKQSVINGTDEMTMDEIIADIADYRKERREKRAAAQ